MASSSPRYAIEEPARLGAGSARVMTDAGARPRFELKITASPEHIDELGHVNNAVWVEWIQRVALAHWYTVADAAHQDAYFWVVVRHEIDYLRAVFEGETVIGRTWVGEAPRGARFERHMEFVGDDGKVRVRATTQWAILDKASGRPLRVPAEVIAPFMTSAAAAIDDCAGDGAL